MPHRAIDLVHLARQTGGDEQLEHELLALFAEQCDRQIQVIRSAGEMMKRQDAAHTLKGAARAVGAWHVADAAERVEAALGALQSRGTATMEIETLSAAAREARDVIASLNLAA
jgi:HPt (histidine-containing phosphotransfer) domain-containing protein